MDLPGRVKWGWGILGDESLEFVRHPREYLESRVSSFGPIFLGRIVNKPTVFITSNSGVQEMLHEKWENFSVGYKEYFYELFDGSLPFVEGDVWETAREVLSATFSHDKGGDYQEQCRRIITSFFQELDTKTPVVVYEVFKELATKLCVYMFLGVEPSDPLFKEISHLMTTRWRGLISVPVNVKLPLLPVRSGYCKALEAKERLKAIIKEHFSRSMVFSVLDKDCPLKEEEIQINILVYLSALIPKSFGSILTSLVIELCKSNNEELIRDCQTSDEILRNTLYEVQRLWPPFMGGFRIAQSDCTIGGYRVPKDHYVGYVSYYANRDSSVFPQPESFRPERWSNENSQDVDKVWTFGGGPRSCVGKYLAQHLLQSCARSFLELFQFHLVEGQDLSYKMLPIARPKNDVTIQLIRREETDQSKQLSSNSQ